MSKPVNETSPVRRSVGGQAHWNPWEEMATLRRDMEDRFARVIGSGPLSRLLPSGTMDFEPSLDLYETDDKITLFAGVPGFKPEEITVQATGDTITIHGEHKALFEDEKAVSHRTSGLAGSSRFRVSYTLPAEINPNKVKATFKDGVLQLEMPKTEQAKSKTVNVHIAAG